MKLPPSPMASSVATGRYSPTLYHRDATKMTLRHCDSVGAHLPLALRSHLAHPHPQEIVLRFSVDKPLRGAMSLSPWVDFRINHASSRGNADRDLVCAQTLNSWARIFLGQTVEDDYSCPAKAPTGWWKRPSRLKNLWRKETKSCWIRLGRQPRR
ncbi:Alpha/beta hydrolase fold-3 [Penicillium viridicatum]|nr:Alpha/beta hydrolase fold-3 [Penicillium viridicatum]